MKKVDKLLIRSFLGPFLLTFFVVVFILLIMHMLKYMDDILGKDLGIFVIMELLMYFAVFVTPTALPLAVLLSSLLTYGNLGEHFELTAIKSAGISLTRTFRPLLIVVSFITVFAFLSNNYLVPEAALKAYSLLYDIKQKKPSLDLKEGIFYDGIPGYSIRVGKKYEDDIGLGDLMIYHHARRIGNSELILADSGRMETILNNRYLSLELFNGQRYAEGESKRSVQMKNRGQPGEFLQSSFDRSRYIFSLASFNLGNTDEDLFRGNKLMKNDKKLRQDIDSMKNEVVSNKYSVYKVAKQFNTFHQDTIWRIPEELTERVAYLDSVDRVRLAREDSIRIAEAMIKEVSLQDTLSSDTARANKAKTMLERMKENQAQGNSNKISTSVVRNTPQKSAQRTAKQDSIRKARVEQRKQERLEAASDLKRYRGIIRDTLSTEEKRELNLVEAENFMNRNRSQRMAYRKALSRARQTKTRLSTEIRKIEDLDHDIAGHTIKLNQKYAHAMACMIMFLIGAPLGSIIKRGGLGIPVIISILFFIIFYVLVISGENWGEDGTFSPAAAAWVADFALLPFAIVFLYQARKDARVFESDFYLVAYDKLVRRFFNKKN